MVNPTLYPSVFSRRMRIARERIGISQMELGVRAGIDEFSASARINQYERGKHAPDFSTVCNLAKVLGVPSAYFYADDEGLADLILCYGNLTPTKRKTLLELAASCAEPS